MASDAIDNAYNDLLKAIGENGVSNDPVEIGLHIVDASSYYFDLDTHEYRNYILVKPSNERDVVETVKTALKYRIPIIPQGSSTSLAMGSGVIYLDELLQYRTLRSAIIVNLSKMNKIVDIRPIDRIAEVEPGVRIDDLNTKLKSYSLFFPIDPASARVASVGGAISTGAGGLRGARFGTMRDWVLAIRFVDGLGRVHSVGCYTIKCRQGLDLARLFVGSEGVLGIITRAVLKLWPTPRHVYRFLMFFHDFLDAYRTFIDIRSRRQPLVAEYVEDRIVKMISESLGLKLPYAHMLLIDIELNLLDEKAHIYKTVYEEAKKHGVIEIRSSLDGEEDFEKLYMIRRSMFPSILRMKRKPHLIAEDTVVPVSKIPEFVEHVKAIEKEYGEDVLLGGHLGDGNLHPHVECDLNDPEDRRKAMDIAAKIAVSALKLMGSVSAEHGIGSLKLDLLIKELKFKNSIHSLDLMRGIKKVFDPYNILNPGRVIPVD